jgi:hypothetical protein
MPSPDPPTGPAPADRARFVRALKLVALFGLGVAALAVALVHDPADGFRIHMLIATFLGVFLSVMLAGGLMLLIFASSRSGHDDAAHHFSPEDE